MITVFFLGGVIKPMPVLGFPSVIKESPFTLRVSGYEKKVQLGTYLSVIEDKTAKLTLGDILEKNSTQWVRSLEEVPSHGYSSSSFWFKLELQFTPEAVSSGKQFMLEIENPRLNSIEYFYPTDEGYKRKVFGNDYPFKTWEFDYRNVVIPLEKSGESKVIFFRVNSVMSHTFPLKFWEYDAFNRHRGNEYLLFGFFFGILLIMIFYNLVIFISIRDITYLYYVLYVCGFLMLGLNLTGFSYQYLWPEESHWAKISSLFFVSLTCGFIFQFSRKFLELKTLNPLADKIARYSIVLYSVLAIVNLIWLSHVLSIITSTASVYMGLFVLVVGTKGVINKYGPARYFMIAWSVFILSIIAFVLKAEAVLPTNLLTEYGLYFGSTVEVFLISLALADRIRILSYDKEKAQKQLIEVMQLDQEKDDMIGVVSHDLKSPLNQIRGLVNLLMVNKAKLDKEDITYLDLINSTAERLINMIRRLLDLNAIETNKAEMHLEPVDMAKVLEKVAESFSSEVKKKKISIHKKLPINDYFAEADKNFLIHIYENILSNAIKFSERNKNIFLSIFREDNMVHVDIKDEGQGISEQDRKKLYGKFQKLSAQPTGGETSTGLGLSIVKKYTEAMGGTISCESELGKGTTFRVSFREAKQIVTV